MSALLSGATAPISTTPHLGIMTGVAAAGAIASDAVAQVTGTGAADAKAKADPLGNLVESITMNGAGLLQGAISGAVGGVTAFVGGGGVEAGVSALTAAAATGFTPASIPAAAGAFMAEGGGEATVAAVDGALLGFATGGGIASASNIVHDASASLGAIGSQLMGAIA